MIIRVALSLAMTFSLALNQATLFQSRTAFRTSTTPQADTTIRPDTEPQAGADRTPLTDAAHWTATELRTDTEAGTTTELRSDAESSTDEIPQTDATTRAGVPPMGDTTAGAGETPWADLATETDAAPAPGTEPRPCPVEVPAKTKCGFLIVPERRDEPGKTIKVGYAVHQSTAPGRKPDPVVYTSGGPGSSSIQLTGYLRQMFPDRDVVTLEQRGSKYSEPRLTCPETVEAMLDRLREPSADVGAAAMTCRTRLQEQGIDLRGYTTREIAADVGALRKALGYPAWNLFGVSYSTRSMLDAAAADPKGVRSVVLDSFLPESVSWYGDADRNLLDTVERLGVKDRFEAMVKRLNAHPAMIPTTDPQLGTGFTARLTGDDVATIMAEALHDPNVITVAPALIDALATGNDDLLRPLADAVGGGLTSHEFGLYHAVQCQDEIPFTTATDKSRLFTVNADKAVCDAWQLPPSKPVNATTKAPVLVLGGQYDPTTPTRTAKPAAELLPNARFVEFAGLGHAVFLSSQCARQTIIAFVGDPNTKTQPTPTPGPKESATPAPEQGGERGAAEASAARCDPAVSGARLVLPGQLIVSGAPYQAQAAPWLLAPFALFVLASLLQLLGGALRGRALTAFAGLTGLAFAGLVLQAVNDLASENEVALAVGLPTDVRWMSWLAVGSAVLSLAAVANAVGKRRASGGSEASTAGKRRTRGAPEVSAFGTLRTSEVSETGAVGRWMGGVPVGSAVIAVGFLVWWFTWVL